MAPGEPLRIVMLLDWFFYYAAGIANALAGEAEILFVTRADGTELGAGTAMEARKRSLLDPRVRLVMLAGRQSQLGAGIRGARHARAAIRAFRPDVLHEQPHHDWRLLHAAGGVTVPRVLTVHDVTPHPGSVYRRTFVHRALSHLLFAGADAYIVHGTHQASLAMRQGWRRATAPVYVVPHGVLAQPSAPSPLPEKPTLLFFGRGERYKGLDILIQAMRLLNPHRSICLVVAGRGGDMERCRALAGNDPRIQWRIGFVSDGELPALFAAASIVVLPYREASQSGVIPLAYANRRAVIASDVGSLAEAVQDGRTGLLVPPEDPASLARAIERALGDRAALEAMSDAALESVTTGNLSPRSVGERHLAIYRELARVGRP